MSKSSSHQKRFCPLYQSCGKHSLAAPQSTAHSNSVIPSFLRAVLSLRARLPFSRQAKNISTIKPFSEQLNSIFDA